ncbi:MAG: trypsin-like peptidase domain-containing protein [Negativicutes bacterium]|nr:trypsin-like peptidase domain-containing protein [Negativicutes bacterium]
MRGLNGQRWSRAAAMLAMAGLLMTIPLAGCGKAEPPAGTATGRTATMSDARNTPVVQVAREIIPTVVSITNKARVRDFFNREAVVEQGSGSGVIVDSKGYIVTNNHVVDGASELVVVLSDGRTFTGTLVGADPPTDLAVVKIDADNLPVAPLGDSDDIMTGEPAIAVGNPLGVEFKGSVTVGVISAVDRVVDVGDRQFHLIQTDAAINPGNSGGALCNADGKVIGINSIKIAAGGVEGMGFAIPINTVKPIMQALIENGKISRSYLGVSIIDRRVAQQMGWDWGDTDGVLVLRVQRDSPAYKAGMHKGDIIVKVGDKDVRTVSEVRTAVSAAPVGSTVPVVVDREGMKITLNVTMEEMPAQ